MNPYNKLTQPELQTLRNRWKRVNDLDFLLLPRLQKKKNT